MIVLTPFFQFQRHWLRVKKYFAEIKAMPAISLRDMNVSLSQHSKNHKNDFNVSWALYELYTHHVKLCYDTVSFTLLKNSRNNSGVQNKWFICDMT